MDILSESIFVMPACRGLNNFGTMHLMATNFIMWIRILFKESVHTVVVAFDDMKKNQTDNTSCNPIPVLANASELANVLSNKYGHEIHGQQKLPEDFLKFTNQFEEYLYPTLIEFSLIGAIFAIEMAQHIGK